MNLPLFWNVFGKEMPNGYNKIATNQIKILRF